MRIAGWQGRLKQRARYTLRHTPLGRRHIYIVRDSKGRTWKGPYRHGWTRNPKEYYLFGTERFALHALKVTGETGVVERVM
jgi:hypothetical protein